MAAKPPPVSIQVINVDLAVERQKILKDKLTELFQAIGQRLKPPKSLIYIINQENAPLETVLRTNPHADSLLTTFPYDLAAAQTEEDEDEIAQEGAAPILDMEPHLRYPVLGEYLRLFERGMFKHRRLILVEDLYKKIHQFLKSGLEVKITVFSNPEHTEVSPPIPITNIARLSPDESSSEGEEIPVSSIRSIQVNEVVFHGVINMPEVGNRFVLKDGTITDAARLLYSLEGLKEVTRRENLTAETMVFVRGKRVLMVLSEDLAHVVAERLTFDKMENLYRYTSAKAALEGLGQMEGSGGTVDYLESNGYDMVFNQFTQEERDTLLMAVLGDKLGELAEKEIRLQPADMEHLDDKDAAPLLGTLPEFLVDEMIEGLKNRSYERFLALVSAKIREHVIMAMLQDPMAVKNIWGGLGDEARHETLVTQAPSLLASLYLNNTPLYQQKFPNIPFDLQKNITSQTYKGQGPKEQASLFASVAKNLSRAAIGPGVISKQLSPGEIVTMVTTFIMKKPGEFYQKLTPVVRKNLWTLVGHNVKDHLTKTLHYLDKLEILKGNRALVMPLLFGSPTYLGFVKKCEKPAYTNLVLMTLKKHNKLESKSGLLKTVLTQPDWKSRRVAAIAGLLADQANQSIRDKLAEHEEGGEFVIDSLICNRADHPLLKTHPALAQSAVIFVDDLVDTTLLELFDKKGMNREDYTRLSQSVEKEIEKLKGRMAEAQTDDPVGVYILESMSLLNQMTNQAMQGKLSPQTVEQMDSRRETRRRMLENMKNYLAQVEDFLAKADENLKAADEKTAQAQEKSIPIQEAYQAAYNQMKAGLRDFRKAHLKQVEVDRQKRQVAQTQKDLSLVFFEIIRPLLIRRISPFPAPLRFLIKAAGWISRKPVSRRIIFKFSDAELDRLKRLSIAFCTKNEVLKQFIVTCLRIDKLENSLFSFSSPELIQGKQLKPDLAFFGPGYQASDFNGILKAKRVIDFADEFFTQRLMENEKLKGATKELLIQTGKEVADKKTALENIARGVKEQEVKLKQIREAVTRLEEDKASLMEKVAYLEDRRLHFTGETELLESRMEEVDGQFDQIKTGVSALLAKGEGSLGELDSGQKKLAQQLAGDLAHMNSQLARMMFIKGVKDAGEGISKSAQQGIVDVMDNRERYRGNLKGLKKIILADDGSHLARNLKRQIGNTLQKYLKLTDDGLLELSLTRLEHRVDTQSRLETDFLILLADSRESRHGSLRKLVKKLKARLPGSYQMVFATLGETWAMDPSGEEMANIRSLKDHCALINATLLDGESTAPLLALFQEKIPLA
ncbi:MAG: hypothetical protein OEW12_04090 [Deltaproteobacteria bacterium]|nr:hypothetical protein [Deltaproteobacteria bacterium]